MKAMDVEHDQGEQKTPYVKDGRTVVIPPTRKGLELHEVPSKKRAREEEEDTKPEARCKTGVGRNTAPRVDARPDAK